MFCVFTLPWYCKASVVAYDLIIFTQKKNEIFTTQT